MWHFKYFRTQTNTSPPETHTRKHRRSRVRKRMRRHIHRYRYRYSLAQTEVFAVLQAGVSGVWVQNFCSALDFWQLQSCNEFVEEFANEVRRFLQIKCNLIWNCIRGNCWECSWWHSNEGTNVRSLNLNLPLARKVESTLSGARPQTFKPHLESQFALWPGKKGKNQIHLITQNPRTRYTRKQNKQSETTRISYIPVRI